MPEENKPVLLAPYEEALAGIGAGLVSTMCMHPLDRLKVQFQIATASRGIGIMDGLTNIVVKDGWQGLYRGLSPNLMGNASSWGFYFLWYTMIKRSMASRDPSIRLSAPQHLFASASSGVITAFLTNPLWVVKTRMFTSARNSQGSYRNVFDGLYKISRYEGVKGLYKGTILALVGVSNGAIQFMTYEELKRWGKDRKRRSMGQSLGGEEDTLQLSNTEYLLMSGSAKLVAIGITYPYQVVRSRLQNQLHLSEAARRELAISAPNAAKLYTSHMDCITRTFREEGMRAFYKGLWPSAIRVLPGTCVTFVVYENIAGWVRRRRQQRLDD